MKIVIIGADGQLGYDLCRVIPKNEQVSLTIKDLDITNQVQTTDVLKRYQPDVVINTAAYTAVDAAETHQAAARAVNETGAKNVAAACLVLDAALVQISTDYVFSGDKPAGQPYTEEDKPDPRSFYGQTKLAGEEWVKKILTRYFIVRSAGLYGCAGCLGKGGGNFVETIIKKAARKETPVIVNDEFVSPTYTHDLAGAIYQLISTELYGLYHLVNQGQCSWYEFGARILALIGSGIKPDEISRRELRAQANRPVNSALASVKLKQINITELRPWQDALQAYLRERETRGGR
jgi:dTDP-4-dehydrorhamnose reductase